MSLTFRKKKLIKILFSVPLRLLAIGSNFFLCTVFMQTSLGAFVLKSEDSGDDISAGSLFKQKKEQKESVPLTG